MQSKKSVAIIGTVGVPAHYGGFETLAEHLVRNLGTEYDITVYCSGKKYPKEKRQATFEGARLVYLPLEANGASSILYDAWSILHACRYADVLLILGVAGAWMLPFVRLFTNKRIIISIDGIEWKRDKWGTLSKLYLWWAERMAVRYSHIDISDNESIQDYTAVRYGSLSRIIEYGADHTLQVKPSQEDINQYPFLAGAYAFKVCRIEPENNVHVVLDAFAGLPRHTFVMIGNWNNSLYGKRLKEQYGSYPNIHLLDPIYHQQTLDVIRGNASIYIHGHSAGGTNPSLVEAMYLGLPVLAFHVSYNKTTTEHKARYFSTAEELRQLIIGTPEQKLKELGLTMRAVALRRYRWSLIARKYAYLVEEAVEVREKISVTPRVAALREDVLLAQGAGHLKHQQDFYIKRK